jgi:hypothetical protein
MVPGFVAKPNIVDRGEARVRLGDIYVVYLKDGGSVAVWHLTSRVVQPANRGIFSPP